MLLGIVLHGAIPYMATPGISWPFKDPNTHRLFDVLVILIHMFRMPVFFVMAGFFAAFLYLERGEGYFVQKLMRRILQPIFGFWPVLFFVTVCAFWYAQREPGQRTEASIGAFGLSLLPHHTW